MTSKLRQLSIANGLIIPDNEVSPAIKICCKGSPALHEMELASRPHRWAEMRELQKKAFGDYMDKVTEYEIRFLDILGLPDIDKVRADYTKQTDEFEYTPGMGRQLDNAVKEWEEDLTGDNDAIYQYLGLAAFAIGLSRSKIQIVRELPDELSEYALRNEVLPALDNTYLRAVINDGTKRINARLSKKYLEEIKLSLRYMAREGKSPLEVARMIHGMAGEGQAWWWLRLARSEAVLAADSAYMAQATEMGVKYDVWSAASNACPICQAFHGKMWPHGEGPEPVSDTHPNCGCRRVGKFIKDRTVQKPWNRPSPYEQSYTREEVDSGFSLAA